ncbi:unnamed protein product [Musa acuminata subsp. malaccensis]|uniref:(wild Malaysian banana) hypothetical protein n=1 Tax=Musa acuminata subsp. malaccensis TaxID=214687 RepID=A0A8D6ZTD1_MUSAM|nr:unnamed protein product [Musa acuminata subsp. malaccensis]
MLSSDGIPFHYYISSGHTLSNKLEHLQNTFDETRNLLRVYSGFNDMEVLVDVDGIDGTSLQMFTSRHPHIKGINYNLPHIISGAQPMPGVEHISRDMFEAIPSRDAHVF